MRALALALAVGIASLYLMEAIRYCARLLRWVPRYEQWERATHGQCPTCGYNLTGNVSGTCPECGTKLGREVAKASERPSLITERQPWWVWAVVVGMILIALLLRQLLWV